MGQKKLLSEMSYDACTLRDIPEITETIECKLEELDFSMKGTMQISIAIDELYSNICKFAYDGNPGFACVRLSQYEDCVEVEFVDKGKPYNPLEKEDPDLSIEALEERTGGLGIYMVKKSMNRLEYAYSNGENHLHLFKNFED